MIIVFLANLKDITDLACLRILFNKVEKVGGL
jgi:hypothetical protein